MLKLILSVFLVGSVASFGQVPDLWITTGTDALPKMRSLGFEQEAVESQDGVTAIKVKAHRVFELSAMMHSELKRCGGFMVHDSEEEALEAIQNLHVAQFNFFNYTIDKQFLVEDYIKQVDDSKIEDTIVQLSNFHNRYYKSDTGVQSQNWLAAAWEDLAGFREDVSVELYQHSNWPQPSVILTIQGRSLADEVVVIGGHADSISGWWGQTSNRAPGADDNASGIASITEVIRVAMEMGYVPERTVKFMGYAAEEVGLLGSKDIATDFKKQGINVVGVMQLDMTGFQGSSEDIVMMTDYTNADQNEFIGTLIDTYLPGLSWGYSRCGYGCSDHASWNAQGYSASIPFEAKMNDMNGDIHTKNDTLETLGGDATHSAKFSKLALAYLVEMAK